MIFPEFADYYYLLEDGIPRDAQRVMDSLGTLAAMIPAAALNIALMAMATGGRGAARLADPVSRHRVLLPDLVIIPAAAAALILWAPVAPPPLEPTVFTR